MHPPEAAPSPPPNRSSPGMLARLSAMMFLNYWAFGAWAVTVGAYIAANTGREGARIFSAGFIGYSSAAGAIGSLLAPAIIGFLSDRYFAAERLLAATSLGCALSAWGMWASHHELAFLISLLGYFHCYFPASAMMNKIALSQLADSDAEFTQVRIAGTLGWIVAGLCVGLLWPWATGSSIEATKIPLAIGAISNLLMAAYSLTLPHTPPDRVSESRPDAPSASDSSMEMILRNRPLTAFLLVSVFACMASVAYNSYANIYLNRQGFPNPAALMTLGQASDLVCLAVAPRLIAFAGLRAMFAAGVFAWAVRYALFTLGSSYDASWPIYAAIVIHGPCFVFVFVAGAMLVDNLADKSQRGFAQGLFTVTSAGAGSLLGAVVMGTAQARFLTPPDQAPPLYDWPSFWLVPAIASGLAGALFLATVKLPAQSGDSADTSA